MAINEDFQEQVEGIARAILQNASLDHVGLNLISQYNHFDRSAKVAVSFGDGTNFCSVAIYETDSKRVRWAKAEDFAYEVQKHAKKLVKDVVGKYFTKFEAAQ